jgi:hypothetical protein
MARCTVASLKRKLDRVEELIQERDRPPGLIVCFMEYSDGTIPAVNDRELADWELVKRNEGCSSIFLDPMHEYALRRGWTKATDTMNLSPAFPDYEPQKMPEAPPEDRIPRPIFYAWLSPAEERFRENWTK